MAATDGAGWSGIDWHDWTDLNVIRTRLDQGADPDSGPFAHGRPLHAAAEYGSPEVVAELVRRVDDVDAEHEGRTALWEAVFANRPDNARVLFTARADPWRPMMNGWSPGRLSLATPVPDLFTVPDFTVPNFTVPNGEIGLSTAEATAVAEARRLIAALGNYYYDGLGLACVNGVSAAEAAKRLEATPVKDTGPGSFPDDLSSDEGMRIVGATDVPGGCVISQTWGCAPSMPGVLKRLSAGAVCYGLYANPASGDQGRVARHGVLHDRGARPSGTVSANESSDEILAAYLYRYEPVAYCCAGAGLRLADARAIVGEPDIWLRLPERDWWR